MEKKEKEELYINSLSEYIEFIENLGDNFCLSRGQNKDYELFPGALRKIEENQKYTRNEIKEYLDEFRINFYTFMDKSISIKESEFIIYAQHYGLPTYLLDFSKSHIISLMFAVENAFEEIEESKEHNPLDRGVVYFLNPFELNKKNARKEIVEIDDDLSNFSGPVAIQARKINKRIQVQNGTFVHFNSADKALNELDDENILKKIFIKTENKKIILSNLFKLGFGFSNIYPELNSLSKDILLKKKIIEFLREREG